MPQLQPSKSMSPSIQTQLIQIQQTRNNTNNKIKYHHQPQLLLHSHPTQQIQQIPQIIKMNTTQHLYNNPNAQRPAQQRTAYVVTNGQSQQYNQQILQQMNIPQNIEFVQRHHPQQIIRQQPQQQHRQIYTTTQQQQQPQRYLHSH